MWVSFWRIHGVKRITLDIHIATADNMIRGVASTAEGFADVVTVPVHYCSPLLTADEDRRLNTHHTICCHLPVAPGRAPRYRAKARNGTLPPGNGLSTKHSQPESMEKVTFGEGLFGYEVGPKTAPAVLVVQEWWGVNETIKAHAAYLSEQLGARCLIPDLYKGTVGVTVEEAQHSMENLDFPAAVKELTAAAHYLKTSGSSKIGCIGFCMGGALSLAATQHAEDVAAGVVCYGIPPNAICDPSKITKPVSMHFGEEDQMVGFSDVETAKKVEATLKTAGSAVELFTYPGVGHAFLNSSPAPHASFEARKEAQGFPPYDNTQAQLAWGRITAFLKEHVMT